MSFTSWLRNLCSALTWGRGQRHHGRRDSLRAATHRPNLEVLEDRLTPSLSPATSFPIGPSPQLVVAADFNNDNHLDLATANAGDSTISVLLGDGGGGFSSAIGSSSAANPTSLAVVNFDNDGKLDLATAYVDQDRGWVSVLLGNGDGTFRAPTNPLLSWSALAVAVGDFNGDGNSDLVVSEDDYNSFGYVEVLLGDGRGGFTQGWGQRIGYPNEGVTVADLDLDGNLDAVTVDSSEGGCTGYAMGAEFYAGTTPRGVAAGDFTGDGIPDLVVAGQGVEILPGVGDGSFNSPIHNTANGNMHTGVAVADFNGDGHLDAVTADTDTGTVSLMLGNGNGTLMVTGAFSVGSSPTAVSVGDFNGDGRPDVAVANAGSNTVSVLLNDGAWPPVPATAPLVGIIRDVAVIEGNSGSVTASFTVTLFKGSTETITVAYSTAEGSAHAGSDYQAASGTLTFAPGETSKTIAVLVNGDRLAESEETFFVNLTGATNATINDGQGRGHIVDDEPRISISDVHQKEGKKNQTTVFSFTVTLSAAYDQPVTMSFRTADGTAKTSDQDYVARTGTLTFAPGETTKTITIVVNGDTKKEADETFYLDLFGNSMNSLFTKNRGLGTVLNDD